MIPRLQEFTSARVGLGRTGHSLPTGELLKLQFAHARARQAVHIPIDVETLRRELKPFAREVLSVHSAASDRVTYLRRPDLGRQLDERSRGLLADHGGKSDAVFVAVDGLSPQAVQMHAPPLMAAALRLLDPSGWKFSPVVAVTQGRVAIGDEIGSLLGACLAVVLVGERPGLSSYESLGIYMSWNPHVGLTDADRNCISNIHAQGLSYEAAAYKLAFLMNESRRRELSGVRLKEEANLLE